MDDDIMAMVEATRIGRAAARDINVATIMVDRQLEAHCTKVLDDWLMPQIDAALRSS